MKEIILAILGSTAFTTIVTAIVNDIIHKNSVKNNSSKGTMSLMGLEIRRTCKEAIKHKAISIIELEQLEECYKVYKDMGGNGFIDTLLTKARALPIEED